MLLQKRKERVSFDKSRSLEAKRNLKRMEKRKVHGIIKYSVCNINFSRKQEMGKTLSD
jgi:hypothetical protein